MFIDIKEIGTSAKYVQQQDRKAPIVCNESKRKSLVKAAKLQRYIPDIGRYKYVGYVTD